MKVLVEGHRYELANFEQDLTELNQNIQFIQKEKQPDNSFKTIKDGTTNEEVLAMLIDRMESLNAKLPNHFTLEAIKHCKDALWNLSQRTLERKLRGVEGTANA